MLTATKPVTAEELFNMGNIGRCELIKGEIHHMPPAGAEHGDIALELGARIKTYVNANNLGKAYAAETGFIISRNPDTVRAPDVGFVRVNRLPSHAIKTFFPAHPDLAIEVNSPGDTASEVALKVDEWLNAGTESVWVVDPATRSVVIHRAGIQAFHYRMGDSITDEPTLPGFKVELFSIFD